MELNRKMILPWCRDNTNLLLLFVMIVAGSIMTEHFFTFSNMMNLFNRVSINGIMAIGFTLTFLVGGFDLSIGATLSLAAILCIMVEKRTGMPLHGFLTAISAGAVMGLFNGFLMKLTRGEAGEAFLITLGTSLVGTSLAMTFCGGLDVYGTGAPWYRLIGQVRIGGLVPSATFIWFVIMVLVQVVVKRTRLGKHMLLTGANKHAAFLSGINIGKMKILAFTLAGILAAVAAIVMAARTTAASPRSGAGADFDAAVATIIGGNSLIDGKGGMVQVFIGVLTYGLITNILNLMTVESHVQYIVKGLVLLLAICLDKLKER
jgi:ribose/xylose/arabinose/galactoside ABC-type transport system permease subunit